MRVHTHRVDQGIGDVRLRSLLFVPGDRPDRMEKALLSSADALILDLEDAVAEERKDMARAVVAKFLIVRKGEKRLFVRINPLDDELSQGDLRAVAPCHPDGIMLPKSEGHASVGELERRLDALGNKDAKILPIATETPAAIFQLGTYVSIGRRLVGLTWGAEDLPVAMGAATSRESDGRFTPPYEMARSLTLFAAHAAKVDAIETVFPAFRDLDGLRNYAARARRDGFTGMMAIHPSQVPIINEAFAPTENEIDEAKRIVALFESNPGAGALSLDGRMVDRPHLRWAQRIVHDVASQS